nr:MAG TPA: hypothetical protein [Caudoviricetes sp.]
MWQMHYFRRKNKMPNIETSGRRPHYQLVHKMHREDRLLTNIIGKHIIRLTEQKQRV